jgi:hypothetical protein
VVVVAGHGAPADLPKATADSYDYPGYYPHLC